MNETPEPPNRLVDICTTIDREVKLRFETYLVGRHGLTRGVLARETEEAIKQHIDTTIKQHNLPRTRALANSLLSILKSLRVQATYPHIQPRLLDAVIKKQCGCRDPRTIAKYRRVILQHVTMVKQQPGQPVRYDLTAFAAYADSL